MTIAYRPGPFSLSWILSILHIDNVTRKRDEKNKKWNKTPPKKDVQSHRFFIVFFSSMNILWLKKFEICVQWWRILRSCFKKKHKNDCPPLTRVCNTSTSEHRDLHFFGCFCCWHDLINIQFESNRAFFTFAFFMSFIWPRSCQIFENPIFYRRTDEPWKAITQKLFSLMEDNGITKNELAVPKLHNTPSSRNHPQSNK